MIANAKALWERTVEIAKENVPEPFLRYPHATDLGLGWYPSRHAFEGLTDELFLKALPNMSGAVFPYHLDFKTLSHLAIIPYDEHGELNRRKRFILPAIGKKGRRYAGVFGVSRLRTKKAILLITDDELAICRQPDAIAVSGLSKALVRRLQRTSSVVQLQSRDPFWLGRMTALARTGTQVMVGDVSLVEHMVGVISALFEEDLSLAVITERVSRLLGDVVPLERAAIMQLLRQRHNLDISQCLPDDFHIYRREGDFYEAVKARLQEKIRHVAFHPQGLYLTVDGGDIAVPMEAAPLGAIVAEIMGADLDLVDWAYRDLKELPHFYLFQTKDRLETRAEVSRKIADVVLAVLCRMAARRDA